MPEPLLSDETLLIVAPEGRDASVLAALLRESGIEAEIDRDGALLLQSLEDGRSAGAIVTDEAITRVGLDALKYAVEKQPAWSDFPFILLLRRGQGARIDTRAIEQTLNATILERPLHPASLISSARSAIRGRHRQRLARRQMEELETARGQLSALADSLESKVRERTRDLATANDRLTAEIAERERAEARLVQAQKMEAVGQLTGGIAHDFNNLLTAVIGSLDLLLRRLEGERERRLANNALHAAERGAKVTAQLLAFSRRQRLSPVPTDANKVVSTMSDLLARSLGPRIRMENKLQKELWAALVDPTQLEMMILNLAINARDAMPSGGSLTISTSNLDRVPAELSNELAKGDYVCISVTDTGVGMPPSVAARAFEPFFTTKEQGKGTGLGLSQLYGFAKQSGGTARIASREGEGTTVAIYLPRTDREPDELHAATRVESVESAAMILLVDDDDDVRAAAAAMIEELGYAVVAVGRGADAIQLATDQDFDLVITDVMMPTMNGVELAAKLRQIRPSLPILFATGYADVEEFGEGLDTAILIRKPFRMADLASRIADAMGESPDASGKVVSIDDARRGRG